MRIQADPGRCVGIGNCESTAPDYFEIGDDGEVTVKENDVRLADEERVLAAIRGCPTRALALEQR